MSKTNLDLFTETSEGLNYSQTHSLVGKLLRGASEQAAAASVVLANGAIPNCDPLQQDSGSPDLTLIVARAAAAGESMVYDVQRTRAGVSTSILTATYTYDATKPAATLISLNGLLDAAKLPLLAGDVLSVVRTYTAGLGATPMANNSIIVEPRPTVVIPNGGGAV